MGRAPRPQHYTLTSPSPHTATHHTLINRLSELEGIVIQGASEAAAYTSKWLVIPRSSPQQPDNEN